MRMYGKGELASLYMPDVSVPVARNYLCSWIKHNRKLNEELVEAGYTPRAKLLTPKQIHIIYKYIGEP